MQWSFFITLIQFLSTVYGDDCYCAVCELDKLPDNCTTIYGHIQMGLESTMPPFEIVEYKLENVTKIVGCVTIANSGFTNLRFLSNLETLQYSQTNNASTCATYGNIITIAKNSLLRRLYFIENLKEVITSKKSEYGIYISDNPSLCITEEELEALLKTEKFYAPHFKICDSEKNYCSLDNFDFFDETNIPEGCQILTDSLLLNGTSNENFTDFQEKLNNIEQVLGSIIVLNSELLSLKFPKLWRIYNFQPDLPVILVQNNELLTSLEFSNISSIPFFGSFPDVLYAFSNPLLTEIPMETCEKFLKLGKITMENDNNGTVCKKQPCTPILSPTAAGSFALAESENKTENSTMSGEKNKPPINATKDNDNFRVSHFDPISVSSIFTIIFILMRSL